MSSRDRDTKSLQDKLKVFFKKGAALPARNELVISAEFERELGPETPLHRRLRAIKEVTDKALILRIHSGGVEKIWSSTVDLLRDQNPELRHAVLSLLRAIAEGQADYLLIMRAIMFRYLRETHPTHQPEDYQLRFKLLYTLTNTGKNITDFEEEIGPFLLEWLPQLQAPGTVVEFLQLIINVVKFNATYLDEDIVHGIVINACHLCVFSAESSVVVCAVSLLEAVVSYSLLPRSSLRSFVCALARTVNVDHYCKPSWKLMRSVLGADIGHAALQEMLEVAGAGAGAGADEAGLVRGAVFYVSMALWGPRRVPTLKVSYLAVLGAFRKALEKQQSVVTYEVVLALQSLVTRVGPDLHDVAWDIVFDILRAIIDHDKSLDPPNELIHTRLHAVITALELLHDRREYCGDVDALLDLVDYCGHDRPESSTMRLVSGRCAPPARDDLPPLARSKRSNTISVMNPTRRNRDSVAGRVGGPVQASGGGITPSFVLLQLYHNMSTYPICPPVPGEVPDMLNPLTERPLKVTDVSHERTIKNLDLVPPVETYKVGVLYVGPGQQDDEVAILRNEYGSVRYSEFLSALGTLVSLDGDEDHPGLFLNLEKGGKDGHYTYVWNDDIMQVLFHVGTAMPYSERDPTCNEKRKYIGNDYVSIVYNDSGEDFNIHTIKGQLNFCIVVVEPLEHGVSRVLVKTKDERIRTKFLPHLDAHVVSDHNVALLARQHALHCALASHISQSLKHGGAPYASNSLERLRHIKRLRRRLEAERLAAVARAPKPYADHSELAKRVAIDDFNDYT